MFKIISKENLAANICRMVVEAPPIARAARPGNFVVVIPTENAERIPLTIADSDAETGSLSLIFQAVGATTMLLCSLEVGTEIPHLLGPLGQPSEIRKFGTVVVIGGGVGIAEIYPLVKALGKAGNEVIVIIGARCQDLLIYQHELGLLCKDLRITTDDGSCGRKGFVSDELKDLIASGRKITRVVAVGPVPMMKACCEATKPHGIKTIVSLNPLMLDATGMCGVCRVTVGGQTKFACVEGPEFDGQEVDFKELSDRLKAYKDVEKQALDHACKLLGGKS